MITSTVVATIATIVGPELLGIPQAVAPVVGFCGTMVIFAAAQSAGAIKKAIEKK